jgi:hypothetical protein
VLKITQWIKINEKVWIAITPEGTRSEVKHWKTGAARMAWDAQVPLVLVGWDYPKKNDHWYAMATHRRCRYRYRYRNDESLRHQKFHWQELRQLILNSLTIHMRRKKLINSINK